MFALVKVSPAVTLNGFYFVTQKPTSSGGRNSNSLLIQNILLHTATLSDSEGFYEFCDLSL